MVTDQDLGGHKEIISNSGNRMISKSNKIILSKLPATGTNWIKILRTRIQDYVMMETYMRDNVR